MCADLLPAVSGGASLSCSSAAQQSAVNIGFGGHSGFPEALESDLTGRSYFSSVICSLVALKKSGWALGTSLV